MSERINVDALRYAVAVAATGSFSAAARDCGVTQPALSNSVARLEDRLGNSLFTRSTRGVTLTQFGQAMLPLFERAVAVLDGIDAEAARWQSPGDEAIRMGVSPLINPQLVARVYSAACSPTVLATQRQLVLREANMMELQQALADGELDLILIPSVAPTSRYEHRIIDSEPVVLVESSPGSGESAGLGDLEGKALILMPDTCGLTAFTQDLLATHGMPMRAYPGEAASYRVLAEWASLGLGAALLPRSKLASPLVPHRKVIDDGVEVEIFYEAVWDPFSPSAADLSALVEHLSANAA